MKHCDVSYFVTLTYNDESLLFADDEPCLYKRHLQLHFKKLRKRLEPRSIKYFAVGEYGDVGCRPHYHYLIFYRGALDRFKLLEYIKECWDYGFSQVLPVNGAQGYVTKYVLKLDNRVHLVKPFSMISNGLGIDYLSTSMKSYLSKNLVSYASKPGGYRISLPRYYKDKVFSTAQKLLMKTRADIYRHELEVKKLDNIEFLYAAGINPFKESIKHYQNRLYKAFDFYRQKKKL